MYLELIERFNLGQVNVKTKVADRIVVVTTSSIIKLDNKYKVMKTISLEKVSNPSHEGWSNYAITCPLKLLLYQRA